MSTWRDGGRWTRIPGALLAPTRGKAGKTEDTPSAGSIDSSTVQATEGADRGSDGGKRIEGRTRHPIVDTLGLLFALVVTGAKVEDAVAAPALVRQIGPAVCPRWEVLWADSKYHDHARGGPGWGDPMPAPPGRGRGHASDGRRTGIQTGPMAAGDRADERGVKRSRRNALDYEQATASSEAMVRSTRTKVMLNRLTDEKPEFPFRYPKVKKTARIFPNRF